MNTDNVTISGETIDYGPCAFMDTVDPKTVFSSIDGLGRYSYENQPRIMKWNLERFGEALLPVLAEDQEHATEIADEALAQYASDYHAAWATETKKKLGLPHGVSDAATTTLMTELLRIATDAKADFTRLFRELTEHLSTPGQSNTTGQKVLELGGSDEAEEWLSTWLALAPEKSTMERANPVYIPRNHLVDAALESATAGDMQPLTKLLEAVSDPYERIQGYEVYERPDPDGNHFYRTYCGT